MGKVELKYIALILFIASIIAWMYGHSLESMESITEDVPRVWTSWDYIACALLISAAGFALAAFKFKEDDEG